jgi:hypothetical protein
MMRTDPGPVPSRNVGQNQFSAVVDSSRLRGTNNLWRQPRTVYSEALIGPESTFFPDLEPRSCNNSLAGSPQH